MKENIYQNPKCMSQDKIKTSKMSDVLNFVLGLYRSSFNKKGDFHFLSNQTNNGRK